MKYIKYLFVFVLALLMVSFIPKEKRKKPTLPGKGLVGHVQYIQEVTYHAIMDSASVISKGDVISDTDYDARMNPNHAIKTTPSIETWTYDENGDEIENAKYHANGALVSKTTHMYNENGDVKEVMDSSFPYRSNVAPTAEIQQYTYKYDASGNILTSNKWEYSAANRNRPEFTRTVNFYDSVGKLRETETFNTDTVNPVSIIWNTYNEKGKLVETDERKRDGNTPGVAPFEKNDFWYDRKGRLYDKATYHPHVGLVKDEKITFDSNGKTVETYSYGMNRVLTGSVEKRTFNDTHIVQEDTYDAYGQLTDYTISHLDSTKHLTDKGVFHINHYSNARTITPSRRDDRPDDTVMVHHIVNDEHYNTVVDDNFSKDGQAISQKSYQYTYDSIGNWIDKIQYNGDKPIKVVEREIGYFKE